MYFSLIDFNAARRIACLCYLHMHLQVVKQRRRRRVVLAPLVSGLFRRNLLTATGADVSIGSTTWSVTRGVVGHAECEYTYLYIYHLDTG